MVHNYGIIVTVKIHILLGIILPSLLAEGEYFWNSFGIWFFCDNRIDESLLLAVSDVVSTRNVRPTHMQQRPPVAR